MSSWRRRRVTHNPAIRYYVVLVKKTSLSSDTDAPTAILVLTAELADPHLPSNMLRSSDHSVQLSQPNVFPVDHASDPDDEEDHDLDLDITNDIDEQEEDEGRTTRDLRDGEAMTSTNVISRIPAPTHLLNRRFGLPPPPLSPPPGPPPPPPPLSPPPPPPRAGFAGPGFAGRRRPLRGSPPHIPSSRVPRLPSPRLRGGRPPSRLPPRGPPPPLSRR